MSPVHSLSAPSFRIRRRHVSPTTVGLFPECPDAISPIEMVRGPAPVADQLGSISDQATLDCPPASRTKPGTQSREQGPVRNDVVAPPERAHARLVGIARLAASSPPAETRRRSAEKPEYFVLPVKSILNRCDSNRVPFEWTINPYRGCEFACKYCYARYTHEYMELDGGEFEKKIYVKKIAVRSSLQIDITVTTLRSRLARLLEPRAPQPRLRLAAVKELREAGLQVGVSASPLLPGITDGEGELEAVAAAAKEAGAQWFFSGVLFLMPSSAKQFLPFVREKFPLLARQYEQWYSKNGYAPEDYRRKASERVGRIRRRYGFESRPWVPVNQKLSCSQMALSWDAAAVPPSGAPTMAGLRSCATG